MCIIFGLVNFFLKKSKSVQTVRFRFSYFITKTIFSVWLEFFLFGFGSVCFFDFRFIKLKSNWIGRFFKISNRFNRVFFTVRFFQLLFSGVLGLIDFSVFFLTTNDYHYLCNIHKLFYFKKILFNYISIYIYINK